MKIDHFLHRSRATESFRDAVARFLSSGAASERIRFDLRAPSVKVERTLAKILVEYPELELESVELRASSGCEFFRGVATIRCTEAEREVEFHWDCRWRA